MKGVKNTGEQIVDVTFHVRLPYKFSSTVTNSVEKGGSQRGQKTFLVFYVLSTISLFSLLLQDNVEELSRALDLHTGIMGYISKFWRGFFPILIIELETSSSASEHPPSSIEDGPGQSNEVRKENNSLKEANGFYVPFLFTHHLRKKAFLSGSVFFLRDPLFPSLPFPKIQSKNGTIGLLFSRGIPHSGDPAYFYFRFPCQIKNGGIPFPEIQSKNAPSRFPNFPVKKKHYSAVLKSNALEINWSILFFAG